MGGWRADVTRRTVTRDAGGLEAGAPSRESQGGSRRLGLSLSSSVSRKTWASCGSALRSLFVSGSVSRPGSVV
eukprot:2293795-Rhodomonas_salina.1